MGEAWESKSGNSRARERGGTGRRRGVGAPERESKGLRREESEREGGNGVG